MQMNEKYLSAEMIYNSPEIQDWLHQFEGADRSTAESLLLRLKFISRDAYAEWLLSKLEELTSLEKVGVFAVRKLKKGESVWDDNNTGQKSSQSQGSEDLVLSIISQAKKLHPDIYFDHPSIYDIRESRVHHIVLLDDSMGSGMRVSNYLNSMTSNKTFLSWLSGGFITIHAVSYARTIQAEKFICKRFPGSNHGQRVRKVSDKLIFDSLVCYDGKELQHRWGADYEKIKTLSSQEKKIPKKYRKGFGKVMANIIFFHSVPNNIPGILHYNECVEWKPLFPKRVLPNWCVKIIEGNTVREEKLSNHTKKQVTCLLIQIKRGLRTVGSLSRSTDSEDKITKHLLGIMIEVGLISPKYRITESGLDFLHTQQPKKNRIPYNFSLYVPRTWCADQKKTQPSESIVETLGPQIDPIEISSMGGGDRQFPLERTDAMATPSPTIDMTKCPSWPRDRHLDSCPAGSKD